MKNISSKELRKLWLDFFKSKDHMILESESLIPKNDPSLLWINSGVATLKDYFSGKKMPPKNRIANSQKSIRTNDIENVGVTSRHHTLFEMLGNFSIGDYFKDEAIEFAWEFLTKELEMPKEYIYITYFKEDSATYKKWLSIGVDPSHLIPGDKDMNFWDMGIGPCGPDTEIFFDRGERFDSRGIELIEKDIDNDRFIEIWNIVFSEFNNDGEGNYTELAQKNIDTGAGLERIASILQGGYTNFDTDLFIPIIKNIEMMSGKKYIADNYFSKDKEQTKINKSIKIIADHMRAVVNSIQDGAKPSNVSRGYIIRRLIRRAYKEGIELGIKEKEFLYKLTNIVKKTLPFDVDVKKVEEIIMKEELSFAKTIEQGKKLLDKSIVKGKEFDFAIAFKLFETYGFPIELTQEILKEKNIKLDISKFKKFKDEHAKASRGKEVAGMSKQINSIQKIEKKISEFIGYGDETPGSLNIEKSQSKVLRLFNDEAEVEELRGEGYVVFDKTPFYATSGGQRHDKGTIVQKNKTITVKSVFKDKFGNHIHKIDGCIKKDEAFLEVDHNIRNGLMRNHSATHLLYAALREIYTDEKIEQLGSDNNEERLRFDFPLNKKPTEEEVERIEKLINNYILQKIDRKYIITDLNGAEKIGAIMTIEEEGYSEKVRVVNFEGITKDLCGGTHVPNTGIIEKFKIINIENKGSGVYRIEAITSKDKVDKYLQEKLESLYGEIEKIFNKNILIDKNYSIKVRPLTILEAKELLKKVKEDNKRLSKKSAQLVIPDIDLQNDYYIDLKVKNKQNVKPLAIGLREKYPKATFVLASSNEKVLMAISSKQKDSNKIIQNIFNKTNGKGGGSSTFAQGVCEQNDNLEEIVEKALK